MTNRYCLAVDIKNDAESINSYVEHHRHVWPQIKASIIDAGITAMEIYLTGNRLFMIMEVDETFSFEKKAEMDKNNPKVQEWYELMWKLLEPLPHAKDKNWELMTRVFSLNE